MDLKQKVNELINIIENICLASCDRCQTNAITGLDLNDSVSFIYHKDLGVIMYYNNLWYLDEQRVNNVTGVTILNMREKLIQLVDSFYVDIKDIERMVFELS